MDAEVKQETKRGRVRRLLLSPLQELGFRFKRGTPEDVVARKMAGLCDDLAYLSDQGLTRMALTMRDKGQGSAKNFWPERATFIAFAQVVEPRPIEEMPGLASWFGSAAGTKAVAEDRLVAEYRWWRQKHRPPMTPLEWSQVEIRSRELRSQASRLRERVLNGHVLGADDDGWLAGYDADHAAARALVSGDGC